MTSKEKLLNLLQEFSSLEIDKQIDYEKFYLYSIITHSTAIEGSTVTEIENQLLFDEGISAKGRSIHEQMMNLDLRAAYDQSLIFAKEKKELSTDILIQLASLVMEKTGTTYNTMRGPFSSKKGELRLINVTAGSGGKSYVGFEKVLDLLKAFCENINERNKSVAESDILEKYYISFDAHFDLVTIHPWADGNGRMSRLIMNQLQFENNLIPSFIKKENKATYIQALIDAREKKDKEIIRSFLLNEHIENIESIIKEHKKSLQ